MYGLPYEDVDYCKYGMDYRKRTRIWNNVFSWCPKGLCKRDCNAMNDTKTRHTNTAQRGPTKQNPANRNKQQQLYRVPRDLIYDILHAIPKD